MKILHFAWDTPIPGAGGSTHEWNISYAFKKLGNDVVLVCDRGNEKEKNNIINGIKIKRFSWRNKKLKHFFLFFGGFIKSLIEIKKNNPNIIYERYRILGGQGIMIGKLFGKKTILEVNDPTIDAPFIEGKIGLFKKLLASIWERIVFSNCDEIISHSKIMVKRANLKKVKIITNGVNVEVFNPKKFSRNKWKNKYVCLFVGTFCKWQGLKAMIKTANILKKEKKILFVFVGAKGKNTKNSIFLGKIDYKKIPEIISQSDLCIYIPDTENYLPMKKLGFYFSPLKLFEYMSMAKPIIVSDVENLNILVKNRINGFRINPNDSKSLAEKIIFLKNNKKLSESMGKNNRNECIKKYNWIIIAKKIVDGLKK
ncbi:MAG: glycosyltransferase family 4 protein [Candidatus Nanoarchaeia archaeon]|jgi:glycosyltransferase involved in cell wall biosynthesis